MVTADIWGQTYEALQLNRAERLVMTAMRRLVLGLGMCPGIAREFEVLCGPRAAEVISVLRLFLGTLDRTARRRLTVAPPGWFAPTADERQMLAMLAAAQCGDEELLGALARWLARSEMQLLLVQVSHRLADVLAACNLRIASERVDAEGPSAARVALRLVS
jgi:hypothetical protein